MKKIKMIETDMKDSNMIDFAKTSLFAIVTALLFIFSMTANGQAQSFGGAFEGMSNSKEPVQIEADRLEVIDGQGVALFDGNVAVTQGSTLLKTRKLKVYYLRDAKTKEPGGNVKKIEATGKVAVRSGDQMATADKAVVDMKGQIAVLSGNVTVSQGENILTGCTLRINMATSAANMTACKTSTASKAGRPVMVFKPKSN